MPFTITADTTPRFPTDISFEQPFGPVYNTDVVILESGWRQANSFWPEPIFKGTIGYGPREIAKIETVLAYFHALRGQWRKFRYKDWNDYKSCAVQNTPTFTDQVIATATAGQTQFQLIKKYVFGPYSNTLKITRPRGSTVRIGVNTGSGAVEETSGWTVNETNGLITRSVGLSSGNIVTAGFEYDRPVTFNSDELMTSFRAWTVSGLSIEVIGVRE